jgi:hypothetical protein
MTRVIGPRGNRRRRRFLFAPILCIAALALLLVTGAQAVHDVGIFELDRNAVNDVAAGQDWSDVYTAQSTTPPGCPTPVDPDGSGPNTLTVAACRFATEDNNDVTIFTGGASKDDLNTTGWQWKDGSVPDKDNLADAYTIRYKLATQLTSAVTASATSILVASTAGFPNCLNVDFDVQVEDEIMTVTACGPPDTWIVTRGAHGTTAAPHAIGTEVSIAYLYFGADRLANNGDSQIGFWFFRKNVGPCGVAPFTCTPSGSFGPDSHQNGDILILSDFTKGGDKVTIRVFEWHSPGGAIDGTLDLIAGTTTEPGDCVATPGVPDGDNKCATVNIADTATGGWSFNDKANSSLMRKGEFYEGGVNLTASGVGNECFTSFLAETRSSQSTDAVLKDFLAGQFPVCAASITTGPKLSNGDPASSVAPGTPVHDHATITGNQPTKTPTGTVTFFLCSFAVGSTATSCDTGGDNIGTGLLSGSGAIATADSPNVNCAADGTGCTTAAGKNPLSPGHYCFRAEWPGDTNYTDPLPRPGEVESGECFNVTVIATQIATSQFFYPNDSATVSTATGLLPAGNVVFKLFGPTTGSTALQNCTANSGTVGSGGLLYTTNPAISGLLASQTVSTNNTSVKVPTDVTSLYWRVTYTFNPANSAYTPSSSVCLENTQYTAGTGDTDTATITNDKTPHS